MTSQMNLILIAFITVVGCFQNASCTPSTQSIVAVAMLTRHGDRAPTAVYANDPYAYHEWLSGLGALTQKGIRGLYKSGIVKAERYASILSENCVFYPKNIYVRSSATKRCIASIENFLSGFVSDIWQYVTINAPKDGTQDGMLTYPGKNCRNSDQLFEQMMDLNRPEVIEIAGGKEFVQYVANYSGEIFQDIRDIVTVADTIGVEKENDLPLPPWAPAIYNDYMIPLVHRFFDMIATSERWQTKSGVLMNDMIERLDRYVNRLSEQNIILYSGHDINVHCLLEFLRVFDQTPLRPDYGSVVAVELHRNAAIVNDLEIKIFYFANHSEKDPLDIIIPSCPAPCPFGRFKTIVGPRLETNYDQACNN